MRATAESTAKSRTVWCVWDMASGRNRDVDVKRGTQGRGVRWSAGARGMESARMGCVFARRITQVRTVPLLPVSTVFSVTLNVSAAPGTPVHFVPSSSPVPTPVSTTVFVTWGTVSATQVTKGVTVSTKYHVLRSAMDMESAFMESVYVIKDSKERTVGKENVSAGYMGNA